MPTHSMDLRKRVVAAYEAGGTSIRKVAERFMVNKRTVHRWVRQYRDTQDLTPKKVGTKRVGILDQHAEAVLEIVQAHPDKCLWEYVEMIGDTLGIHVSLTTLHEFLKKRNITLRKKRLGARKSKAKSSNNNDSLTAKKGN